MLAIPRSDGAAGGYGRMSLTLSRGGREYTFDGLLNAGENTLYYLVSIEGTDAIPVGEYDYSLTDSDGNVLSCGILTLGEYKREVKAPDTERKIIEYGG